MNDQPPSPASPPPLPPAPPPLPASVIPYATPVTPPPNTGNEAFVPNLRLKDNLLQLAAGIFGACLGVFVGSVTHVHRSFLPACGIAGLIFGIIFWGFGMGALGLRRKPPR